MKSKFVKLTIGIFISAGALYYALGRVSWQDFEQALSQVKWQWIGLAVLGKLIVLGIKNLRWKVELRAISNQKFPGTFRALCLGYFCNLILPFKLGEVVRTGILRRHNPKLEVGEILSTIVAERLIDLFILSILVAPLTFVLELPDWIRVGVFLLMGATLFFGLALRSSKFTKIKFKKFEFLSNLTNKLYVGSAVLRKGSAFLQASGLTCLVWLIEASSAWAVTQSLAIPISYFACLMGALLIALGALIPSAPGQIGTHQALSQFILGIFAVSASQAFFVSVLLQTINLVMLGLLAAIMFVIETLSSAAVATDRKESFAPRKSA